ncbi:hypothetical protein [Streptacidiphilus neutrinimicus]|uniref:hypothetical protein n=1 Tax=Streptacidiphilus neutrinimicus TaxID=105420 RepID=UPI0005AA7F65|nr:hypothetical protein [Streptacidiphilus neutrinimicus]
MNTLAATELVPLAAQFDEIATRLSGAYADSLTGLALPAAELHALLADLLDRAAQASTEAPAATALVHALTEAAVQGAAAAQHLGRLAAAHGRLGHLATLRPAPARTTAIRQALSDVEAAQDALNRELTVTAAQLRGHAARRIPAGPQTPVSQPSTAARARPAVVLSAAHARRP